MTRLSALDGRPPHSFAMLHEAVRSAWEIELFTELFDAAGDFPNNPRLPLLCYQQALAREADDRAEVFERLFSLNGWTGCWRGGMYEFHHYHSTAHETLGVTRGNSRVALGGPQGVVRELHAGDVLLIPAGVAHKLIRASDTFEVIGAYPAGQKWDMNYGRPEEFERALRSIARVPLPQNDPLFGGEGPLRQYWR